MNYIAKILTNYHQKIPSGKVDLTRFSSNSQSQIPRKNEISGHFHLKTTQKNKKLAR